MSEAPPLPLTYAEINLEALSRNLAGFRSLAPQTALLGVVKANAYGHGSISIARTLESRGIDFLGVTFIEEGIQLRLAGIRSPILILGGWYEENYLLLLEHRLTPIVFRHEHIEQLAAAARKANQRVGVHLKIDTGMGRLGLLPEELPAFLEHLRSFPELTLDGVLSHFACADQQNSALTLDQLRTFRQLRDKVELLGFRPRWIHLANSAGLLALGPESVQHGLTLARIGLSLYGIAPEEWLRHRIPLAPVLSWKTKVVHVKRVAAGTSISYGSTWIAPKPSAIAVLPVGYADGYNRQFSNRASVLLKGQRAPVVGRVCMNMCMVDVTHIPEVTPGDPVVLLGAQEKEKISAEELAAHAKTIPYEILCSLGAHIPRLVIPGR